MRDFSLIINLINYHETRIKLVRIQNPSYLVQSVSRLVNVTCHE
jgi:hypothetical protein